MFHPTRINALKNTVGAVATGAYALWNSGVIVYGQGKNILVGIVHQGNNALVGIVHLGNNALVGIAHRKNEAVLLAHIYKNTILTSAPVVTLTTTGGYAKAVYNWAPIVAFREGYIGSWITSIFTHATGMAIALNVVNLHEGANWVVSYVPIPGLAWSVDRVFSYLERGTQKSATGLIMLIFNGAIDSLISLTNLGLGSLKDAVVRAATESTWQTWGVVAGLVAAYATYRFSGRIIDETISYYAEVAREAISRPFSNIQMKKNIPLITPAFNLVAKGYRQIFPLDPKANPILSAAVQKHVDQIVMCMKNQKKNKGYFQNIVLEGPPGTGKTMIAKKIAEDSGFNFIKMSGSDLANYVAKGTHLSTLNWYMKYAKNSYHPTVLFIDEADTFVAKRETLGSGQRELLTQFLEHTGDEEFNKNVMIIMATNRYGCFDSAVNSRVDHSLYIGPPSRAQRAGIIQEHVKIAFRGMSDIEPDGALNASGIAAIAARTNHLTGRTLQKLVNSLLSVKSSTADNKLTWDMVDDEVHRFVWKDRSSQDASRSWKVIEMISDMWHFTLPWLCRRTFAIPGKVVSKTWSIVKMPFTSSPIDNELPV
ncbi:MAG: AAA family ATPase [Chlamydiales bacterium]|nr:AAA family ATPase [Chlamydiales bacterium]